jgi:hypothetical protein
VDLGGYKLDVSQIQAGGIYDVIVIGDKQELLMICPHTHFDCHQPRTRLFHKPRFTE